MRNVPETVHEYNIPRLNVIFVITSLLLLGSVAWMVVRDYNREWKKFQRESQQFEKIKLVLDVKNAEKKAASSDLDKLEADRAAAQSKLDAEADSLRSLQQRRDQLLTDIRIKTSQYQAHKGEVDAMVSQYDAQRELGRSPAELQKLFEKIRSAQEDLKAQQAEIDSIKGQSDALGAAIQKSKETQLALDKQIRKLTTERDLAAKRLDQLGNPLLRKVESAPLIEFAAPFTRVQQTIAEDEKYDINFTHVPRIDRCSTCHTFIDRKDPPQGQEGLRFAQLPEPWKSHPRIDLFVGPDSPHPVQKFGCSTCHMGWDRGTGFISAAHTPAFLPVETTFYHHKGLDRWMPAEEFQSLEQNARSAEEAMQSWKTSLEQERSSLEAEVKGKPKTPERDVKENRLDRVDEDLSAINRFQGLLPPSEPMEKAAKFQGTEAKLWTDKYGWHEMHHKEDPMRSKEFIEASCWKCHLNSTWIPEVPEEGSDAPAPGARINAAIRLVEQAGCYSCHRIQQLETIAKHKVGAGDSIQNIASLYGVDPASILTANALAKPEDLKAGREIQIPVRVPREKIGPNLQKLPSKVTKVWMRKWLENPKAFRPNTFMPQYWGIDNNRAGMRYPSQDGNVAYDWGDRNAAEMNAIVEFVFSRATDVPQYPPAPGGNAENGKKLVSSIGCYGCHVEHETLDQLPPKDRRFRSQGPQLIGGASKYNPNWLYAWLKDPSQYHPGTRMPSLRLSDQEAADITAYLMQDRNEAFEKREIPQAKPEVLNDLVVDYLQGSMPLKDAQAKAAAMSDEDKNLFAGEKLVRRYGCYSCHLIKGLENEKPISIDLSDWASKRITQLDFGFVKLPEDKTAWLHQKLSNPRSFDRIAAKRPQEYMKMPQYNFSEEQLSLVMTAILSLTQEPAASKFETARDLDAHESQIENGRWLIKDLNCMGCHVVENRGGAIYDSIPAQHMRPPRLMGVGTKVRPDWLYHFIRDPGKYKYRYWLDARMPTFNLSDAQINSVIKYFALVDKQTYPFEASTMEHFSPPADSAATGQKLFTQLNCLQCHKGRTPDQGKADASVAPNLSRVKERMRPDGILTWLKNPPGVTPGVSMPAFWPEEKSPIQNVLDGDSAKQIEAVRDWLLTMPEYGPQSASAPVAAAR